MSTQSSLSHTIDPTIFDDDDYDSDGYSEFMNGYVYEEDEPTLTPEELAELEEWNRRVEEACRRDAVMFELYRSQVKEKEYALHVQKCLMLARKYIENLEEHSSEC